MYQSFRQCKYFWLFLGGDGVDGLGCVLLMGALFFCFAVMDIWYNKC